MKIEAVKKLSAQVIQMEYFDAKVGCSMLRLSDVFCAAKLQNVHN